MALEDEYVYFIVGPDHKVVRDPDGTYRSYVFEAGQLRKISIPSVDRLLVFSDISQYERLKARQIKELSYAKKQAAFLLELMSASEDGAPRIGDIEERYNRMRQKYGDQKADVDFWWRFAREIGGFLRSALTQVPFVAAAFFICKWVRNCLGL
jgi:hypothetical protein